MFYTKLNEFTKTELTDENILTECPICGAELQVDISEVFKDADIDLRGTSVACTKCSRKIMEVTHGLHK